MSDRNKALARRVTVNAVFTYKQGNGQATEGAVVSYLLMCAGSCRHQSIHPTLPSCFCAFKLFI